LGLGEEKGSQPVKSLASAIGTICLSGTLPALEYVQKNWAVERK